MTAAPPPPHDESPASSDVGSDMGHRRRGRRIGTPTRTDPKAAVPDLLHAPAKRPCGTCPYRRDVASGVWSAEEYAKLPPYDADTPFQPTALFQCHLTERDGTVRRVCAGWAGCHDGDNLLALRIGVRIGAVTLDTVQAVIDYHSPLPLFASGAEAAAHGLRDLTTPSSDAARAIRKIMRVRQDVRLHGAAPTGEGTDAVPDNDLAALPTDLDAVLDLNAGLNAVNMSTAQPRAVQSDSGIDYDEPRRQDW